jgi:hypothetical protein
MKTYRAFVQDPNGSLAEIHSVGASAYEVAVANGFKGSQEEWLESLKGADGAKGDKGDVGSGATIDDTAASAFATYSSQKITDTFATSDDVTTLLKPLQSASHIHDNKDTLNKISEKDGVLLFDGEEIKGGSTEVTGGVEIDDETPSTEKTYSSSKIEEKLEPLTKDNHTHNNKTILDNITQDVIDNTHTHTNKTALDKISESDTGTLLYDGKEITNENAGVLIDDDAVSEDTTYSSSKIETLIEKSTGAKTSIVTSSDLVDGELEDGGLYLVETDVEDDDTSNVDLDNYYTKDEVDSKITNVSVDLSDYYTKNEVDEKIADNKVDLSDYYTKNEVDNQVASLEESLSGVIKRDIVSALPQDNIDNNTIYMVLKENETENNVYDEYMYINDKWELIGNTEIDLTNYYNKNEVNSLLGLTLTATLAIGETELTIENENITTTSMIDIYTDTFNIRPTDVVVSNGNITLTFDEQEVAVNVKVVVR